MPVQQTSDNAKRLIRPRRIAAYNHCYYLGRCLRFRICAAENERVVAQKGVLSIATRLPEAHDRTRMLVRKWMRKNAQQYLQGRYAFAARLIEPWEIDLPRLTIRSMKRHWASHSRCGRRIFLNIMLIEVLQICADYAIVSELCQISARGVPGRYFTLISDLMPNWQKSRDTLLRFGQTSAPARVSQHSRRI